MLYIDSIAIVAQHIQDWDMPDELLPLVISNEALLRAGIESERSGCGVWD